MSQPAYKTVPKPLEYRLGELVQSLLVIRDSLELLRVGHAHQVLPIAGQLRALMTDRSTTPLLESLAGALGSELQVWVDGGLAGKRGPTTEGPVLFGMAGIMVTASPQFETQRRVPLQSALDGVVLHAEKTNYTARDVINFLANQAGGAHFSETFPKALGDVMSSVSVGGLPAPAAAVRQFGETALSLGRRFLRELTEVDFHLVLGVRSAKREGPAFLFDALRPEGHMRFFGRIAPNRALTFGVKGIGGEFAATAQNITDWSRPHHVIFRYRLGDNLASELVIVVDGDVRLQIVPRQTIVALANRAEYEIWLNRSVDDPVASCEWALGAFGMLAPPRSTYEEATSLLAYKQKVSELEVYRCMRAGESMHAPVGSDSFEGAYRTCNIREWLASD